MADEVRLKLFEVDRCGYYRRGNQTPVFGSLSDMISDIKEWVADKPLSETATYAPSEDQDQNILRTFCYGLNQHSNGDMLLTTWNETPTTEGRQASVRIAGLVNSAAISTADVQEGYVPGYPAYFWFPNGLDRYATIQLRNPLNGRSNLKLFCQGFLEKYSKYVVINEDASTDEEYVFFDGYSLDGTEANLQNLRASYRCGPISLAGDIDFLRTNRHRIRRIERRDVLDYQVQEDVSIWQSFWRSLTGNNSSTLTGQHRLRLDVECEPSEEDFESIVTHWESENESTLGQTRFHDVGFRLQGENKVRWLSRSLASDLIELDLRFRNDAVLDPEVLLSQLDENRDTVLSLASEVADVTT